MEFLRGFVWMCVQVQEIQAVGAEQGCSREGVLTVPRRPGQKLVGLRSPVPAALRGRRQPRRLLSPWHGKNSTTDARINPVPFFTFVFGDLIEFSVVV